MEDAYLIKKIKKGNYAAFNLLIKRYQNYVYAVLHKIIRNQEDVQEAFQDTFMKVYRSLNLYQEDAKFSTWLYRIAYNTAIDYSRKNKRYTDDLAEVQVQDNSQGAMDELQKKDLYNIIGQYMGRLDEDERSILTLFYLEELSIKEVSGIMNISTSNAKTKLFRARQKLFKQISENERIELQNYYHG